MDPSRATAHDQRQRDFDFDHRALDHAPASTLFAGLLSSNQGLFFDNTKVKLKKVPPGPNLRKVVLDLPDRIFAAGLFRTWTSNSMMKLKTQRFHLGRRCLSLSTRIGAKQ